jgi:hypothetical protein
VEPQHVCLAVKHSGPPSTHTGRKRAHQVDPAERAAFYQDRRRRLASLQLEACSSACHFPPHTGSRRECPCGACCDPGRAQQKQRQQQQTRARHGACCCGVCGHRRCGAWCAHAQHRNHDLHPVSSDHSGDLESARALTSCPHSTSNDEFWVGRQALFGKFACRLSGAAAARPRPPPLGSRLASTVAVRYRTAHTSWCWVTRYGIPPALRLRKLGGGCRAWGGRAGAPRVAPPWQAPQCQSGWSLSRGSGAIRVQGARTPTRSGQGRGRGRARRVLASQLLPQNAGAARLTTNSATRGAGRCCNPAMKHCCPLCDLFRPVLPSK